MGPTVIFDKSALQALNPDEAVWLDKYTLSNIVPVFYVESLADLAKPTGNRSPESVVAGLASKTPDNAVPNVHHRHLVLGDLAGGKIEMTGRPVVHAADVRQATDGSVGVHVDEFPENAALLRWQAFEFESVERDSARHWRAELAAHDPARMVALLSNILPADRKLSNVEQLKEFLDGFCASDDSAVFSFVLELLDVRGDFRRFALNRWRGASSPPLAQFVPYAMHVFAVDALFYLAIARGFESGERASNRVDFAYLYYLPFTNAFVSGDRLHRRTAPLFLHDDQEFVWVDELKDALSEIDAHFDAFPDEIKARGVLALPSYPPSTMDNVVTCLWDQHMRPDWREISKRQEEAIAELPNFETSRATVAELNDKLHSAKPIPPPAQPDDADIDYMFITRRVAPRKGKWRIVSEEVERASPDDDPEPTE